MERPIDPTQPAFSQALSSVGPELDAMPAQSVEPIRHDIFAAILIALGVTPKLAQFRERARAEFGEPAVRSLDRMETSARACGKAHADHLITLHGTDVEEMAGVLGQKRTVLLLEAQGLIGRKVLSASVLGELVGGTSYRGLSIDVLQLVGVFRSRWSDVHSHTAVTTSELDEAEALANAFVTTLGENEQGSASSPSADLRRRAYTLFVHTYDEVRRIVTYFRWDQGDADEFAPSLASGRTRSTDAEEPVVALPTPTSGPVIAPGMPGASPFAST